MLGKYGHWKFPLLSLGCFLLQHTMHCTCSIFSFPRPSEPQVLQVISRSVSLMKSFQKHYLSELLLFSFHFLCWMTLLAEDHHSVTHRNRIVPFFWPSTCCLHVVVCPWEASTEKKKRRNNFHRTFVPHNSVSTNIVLSVCRKKQCRIWLVIPRGEQMSLPDSRISSATGLHLWK